MKCLKCSRDYQQYMNTQTFSWIASFTRLKTTRRQRRRRRRKTWRMIKDTPWSVLILRVVSSVRILCSSKVMTKPWVQESLCIGIAEYFGWRGWRGIVRRGNVLLLLLLVVVVCCCFVAGFCIVSCIVLHTWKKAIMPTFKACLAFHSAFVIWSVTWFSSEYNDRKRATTTKVQIIIYRKPDLYDTARTIHTIYAHTRQDDVHKAA